MTSRERFEYACSLLPAGLCWNEEVTPEIVLHVAAMAERQALERAYETVKNAFLSFTPPLEALGELVRTQDVSSVASKEAPK